MKQHVYIRFGKWQGIIAQPLPENTELFCVTTAMMHYAKAVAWAASGHVEPAEKDAVLFEAAYAHLRKSVDMDDNRPYDEPWGWMQPTRHALAALLLEQGRAEESAAVYKADLGLDSTLSRACQHPDNVWSLHGYHDCLTRLGRMDEATIIKQRLDLANARIDIPVKSSCFRKMGSFRPARLFRRFPLRCEATKNIVNGIITNRRVVVFHDGNQTTLFILENRFHICANIRFDQCCIKNPRNRHFA